jgi:AraC family transcriptional regulator
MAFRGGAVHSIRPPGSQEFHSPAHCFAVMLAHSPGLTGALASDRLQTFDAPAGLIAVNPAGIDSRLVWPAVRENIVVAISPESMQELAAQEYDCLDVELRASNQTVDRAALATAKLIRAELRQPERSNELYLDSLITVFGIHVLRNYSSVVKSGPQVKTGLSHRAASRIREYLHENFRRKITIAELAEICGLSPSHFAQAFSRTFGLPPYQYLLDRRLDFAEKLLLETEMPIAEVAFLSGFSSQSHLTSTMRTYRHTTPRQLRTG